MADDELARYPLGRFVKSDGRLDRATRAQYIADLEHAPAIFRSLVSGLTDEQLDTPYRAGGWTIRQVVHHVPDSHMNMYVRMKLALTEDRPTIKTYEEQRWAELSDARSGPVDVSLDLLEALHRRWVFFLRTLTDADFDQSFMHPELGEMTLHQGLALYAWHARHHAAHIRTTIERFA